MLDKETIVLFLKDKKLFIKTDYDLSGHMVCLLPSSKEIENPQKLLLEKSGNLVQIEHDNFETEAFRFYLAHDERIQFKVDIIPVSAFWKFIDPKTLLIKAPLRYRMLLPDVFKYFNLG